MNKNILKIIFTLLSISVITTVLGCDSDSSKHAISLDDDDEEIEDLLSDAKNAARNYNLHKARGLLVEAKKIAGTTSEYKYTLAYIEKQEKYYEEKLKGEFKTHEKLANQQKNNNSPSSLEEKCAPLVSNFGAWSACLKNEDAVFGMGDKGLNAYYAIRRECNSLAGNDNTGLAYLCENEKKDGCIGLKASQNTIDACYNCNGSNLWLRVYTMGIVLQCF